MKFLDFALISLRSESSFHQFKTCNVLNVLGEVGCQLARSSDMVLSHTESYRVILSPAAGKA